MHARRTSARCTINERLNFILVLLSLPHFRMKYGKLFASAITATMAVTAIAPVLASNGGDDHSSSSTSSVSSASSVSSSGTSSASSVSSTSSSSRSSERSEHNGFRLDLRGNKQSGKKLDSACVKPLVEAREKALGAAWTAFSASMSTAFSTRSSALSAAWSLTDVSARNAAIKAAWQAFAKSGKAAREAWKTAQKTARKTFRDGAKACGISASDASLSEPENDVNVGE